MIMMTIELLWIHMISQKPRLANWLTCLLFDTTADMQTHGRDTYTYIKPTRRYLSPLQRHHRLTLNHIHIQPGLIKSY